jgi:hypothetical protein
LTESAKKVATAKSTDKSTDKKAPKKESADKKASADKKSPAVKKGNHWISFLAVCKNTGIKFATPAERAAHYAAIKETTDALWQQVLDHTANYEAGEYKPWVKKVEEKHEKKPIEEKSQPVVVEPVVVEPVVAEPKVVGLKVVELPQPYPSAEPEIYLGSTLDEILAGPMFVETQQE